MYTKPETAATAVIVLFFWEVKNSIITTGLSP